LGKAHAVASAKLSSRKKVSSHQTEMTTHFGRPMTPDEYRSIIRVELEVILKRFEDLGRLLDAFAQEALAKAVGNRLILHHIPRTTESVFKQYVIPIDQATTAQMKAMLNKIPGNGTVAVDGVTVLSRSYLLYTLSKGVVTVFMKSTQLQSMVHASPAEVADGVKKIEHALSKYNTTVTNIAVDNAARGVMNQVIE
jgi:hypothetical protein